MILTKKVIRKMVLYKRQIDVRLNILL
jgi:hypothetical protein